jgi:TetR/AcrR family transcriptional regulator, cmeABC operon repressor
LSRQTIKYAALSLFAAHGYEGTSLSAIAEAVGIKKASIYSHFDGKEALFLEIFEDVLIEEITNGKILMDKVENKGPKEQLYDVFQYTYRVYEEEREKFAFWKRAMLFPPEFLREQLQVKFINYEKQWSLLLSRAFQQAIQQNLIQKKDIDELLAAFYCLIDGLFIELHYYGRKRYRERAESVWHTFWLGIEK